MLAGMMAYCYVGSYCGAAEPEALRVLAADTETGTLEVLQTVKGVEGTSYFQIDREGRYLYSIIGDERKQSTKGSAVRFPLNGNWLGTMEVLAELPCAAPCHVALSPDERLVAFASYRAGTAGTLPVWGGKVAAYVLPDDAMGPNAKRQEKAFAHQTFFLPDGRLGVVDLGCDRIRFFDAQTMQAEAASEIKADAGDGPRHTVWSKDGRFLYVLNELGSSVAAYGFDGRQFVRVGKWTMLPEGYDRWAADGVTLANTGAAIRLTDDGTILLASNRGHDSIAIYAVDTQSGALELRNIAKLCGRSPRDFALMPGERFVVVGHELDNEVQAYRFDREKFELTPVGKPIAAWRPVCVGFVKATERKR